MSTTHDNEPETGLDGADIEGIYGVDRQGNVTFVNPPASQMLGFTMAELMGQPFHELVQHSRADGNRFPRSASALHAALGDGSIHHNTEEVYFRKDGSCFPVESITTPIRDEGRVVGAIVTFKDLTLRKRVVERFQDELLTLVDHELRTPLNVITGFASMLEDEVAGPLTEDQKHYVNRVLNGTERMMLVINDLVDYAKVRSGKLELERTDCQYWRLVAEVVSTMKPLADLKEIELDVDVEAPPGLQVDQRRLQQVLANLLSNAIKFTPTGGKVTLRAFRYNDELVTQVVDTGPGIASADLPRLFEGPQHFDPERPRGAEGLGLAISKAIVEAHGGTMEVLSERGAGSMFAFTIPLGTR
jgi:PAS domain S-box-containing protein